MSATHRSLIRLPNSIFENLIKHHDADDNGHDHDSHDSHDSHEHAHEHGGGSGGKVSSKPLSSFELKKAICVKLKEQSSNSNSNSNSNSSNIGININNNNKSITTVGQIMRLTPTTLLHVLDPLLTNDECQELIYRISTYCTPKPKTAKELLHQLQKQNDNPNNDNHNQHQNKHQNQNLYYLPTAVPQLDKILRGGIRFNTITEIVGRAGVGKTQLVMQLAVVASALNMGCIYIDTEKKLSVQRLKEIANERYECQINNYNGNGTSSRNDTNDNEQDMDIYGYMDMDTNMNMNMNMDINKGFGEEEEPTIHNYNYKPPTIVLNNISVHTPNSTADLLSVISNLQEEIIVRSETSTISTIGTTSNSTTSNKSQIGNQKNDNIINGNDNPISIYDQHEPMDTNKSNVSPTSSSVSSLMSTYPVKLIILDSIAAPTRRDFGGEDAKERVNAIFQIAQMLKQISGELNVSIVVINQIENNGNRNSNRNNLGRSYGNTNHQQSTITPVKASLGTSWHHCVSTRVLLEYVDDYGDDNGNGNDYGSTTGTRQGRKATVVKSNLVGCASVNFEVTRMGICHCHSLLE